MCVLFTWDQFREKRPQQAVCTNVQMYTHACILNHGKLEGPFGLKNYIYSESSQDIDYSIENGRLGGT